MKTRDARNLLGKTSPLYGTGLDARLAALGVRGTTARRRKPKSSSSGTIGAVPTPRPSGESGYINGTSAGSISRLKPE